MKNYIVKPDNYVIPYNASKIHGISTEIAIQKGISIVDILDDFITDINKSKYIIGHNISFDNNILGCEMLRYDMSNVLLEKSFIDTKDVSTQYCAIPGGKAFLRDGGRHIIGHTIPGAILTTGLTYRLYNESLFVLFGL